MDILMSEATVTIPDMNIDRLATLKADTTTTGQIDYLDQLLTDTVILCRRPGDIERVANTINQLLDRIVRQPA